jgi:hypothetical protein
VGVRRRIECLLRAGTGVASALNRFLQSLDHTFVWWLCFAAGFAVIASRLSTDANFDLENYHLYNGFAAIHDRRALDIVPAQLQTAYFYGLDEIYYLIFTYCNNRPWLINVLLSIPYSLAALSIFLIARLIADSNYLLPSCVSVAAAILGLSGAATFGTFLSTATDLVPGVAFLIALAWWLSLEKAGRNTIWTALGVGGIAGLSAGLKLTQAPFFVGLAVAIAARFAYGQKSALSEALAFGIAGLATFALLDGAWLWGNAKTYGNPIFPMMNNIFQSDLIDPGQWTDGRFLPRSTAMALLYPLYWAFHPSSVVSELLMRDPRILLGCAGALIVATGFVATWLVNRPRPPIASIESLSFSLSVTFLVSYALWETVWSIYRYIAVDEALSGVLVLAALPTVCRLLPGRQWLVSGLFALIVIATLRTTINPDWGRVPRSGVAISVELPEIEPNAMVLFLDRLPYSFVVPWMPSSARAIGVNNNLVHPGSSGRLWSIIEAAVRNHEGPLWGIETPEDEPGRGDASLKSLGLGRDGQCMPLKTNMPVGQRGRICRLHRI